MKITFRPELTSIPIGCESQMHLMTKKDRTPSVEDQVLGEIILAKTSAAKQEALNEIQCGNPGPRSKITPNSVEPICKVGEEKKFVLNVTVPAGEPGSFQRLVREADIRLVDLGLPSQFLIRTRFCLVELVANALEHGSRGNPAGVVNVKAVFRRGAAMISVGDMGSGFDVDAILQRAREIVPGGPIDRDREEQKQPDLDYPDAYLGERGRGLPIVLALADDVQFTNGGRDVMVKLSHKVKAGTISADNLSPATARTSPSLCGNISNHVVDSRNVVIIEWTGEVGTETVNYFKDRIDQVLSEGVTHLILDLAGINRLNSMGFGVIAAAFKKIRKQGGQMVICQPSPCVHELFELTRMTKVIAICPTQEQALAIFKENA
ncbi:MAG: anti-sigma factor antagonist [Candidatus Ozemobacteraceae bacterium]